MCQMRNPREANKALNRTQQKIRQSGIPTMLVHLLYEAVLVCFSGQKLHGHLEHFCLSILAQSAIKQTNDNIFGTLSVRCRLTIRNKFYVGSRLRH